jgi:hypothetical protein
MSNTLGDIARGLLPVKLLLDLPFSNRILGELFEGSLPGNWPIRILNLSTRSENALHRHGLDNLQKLSAVTPTQLMDMRNTGQKSVEEILEIYVSKLGESYEAKLHIVQPIKSQYSSPEIILEQEIWKCLEFLIGEIDSREFSIIRNRLSEERMRILELSDAWGVSRQRTYQIVDKLLEKIQSLEPLRNISEIIFRDIKFTTRSELLATFDHLKLGRVENESSINILDLLIYGGHLTIFKGYLVVEGDNRELTIEEFLNDARGKKIIDNSVFSAEFARVIQQNIGAELKIEAISQNRRESLQKAEEWIDSF